MLPFLNYTLINQHCPWLRMAVPNRNMNSAEAFAGLVLTSSDNTGDQVLQLRGLVWVHPPVLDGLQQFPTVFGRTVNVSLWY